MKRDGIDVVINSQLLLNIKVFLIGLTPYGKLVCCPMDSHGDPDELTPSRVLHDMFDIYMLRGFHSFDVDPVFMGLYKDGEVDYIWLVYTL